jgi:archaeosine synthase beta-subunit
VRPIARDRAPISPISIWKEQDMIEGRQVDAFVVILQTTGCWWSGKMGCLMCGYNSASSPSIRPADIIAQLGAAKQKYAGEQMVKIYTSGSFLDRREVPLEVREAAFKTFDMAERILVESRAEFVTPEELEAMDKRSAVAIGLESANDEILKRCVRKGFTFADYQKAAEALNSFNIPLRTYLLLKPPFLTERAAVEDVVRSIALTHACSESISINPVNVQRDTVVEKLWRRGDYRPPWLWSLLEVLRQGKALTERRVFSSPSGGGSTRGVHNCDSCDGKILEAVQRFSFTQDVNEFEGLGCGCRQEWTALMDVQDTLGTTVDVSRYLSNELEFD